VVFLFLSVKKYKEEKMDNTAKEIKNEGIEKAANVSQLFSDNDGAFEVYADSFKDYGKLIAKMSKAMGEIERVEKNGFNDYHKYEYATADDVEDVARKALSSVGLAMFSSVSKMNKQNRGSNTLVEIKMNFLISDMETGASVVMTYYGTGLDKQDKYLYKAYTGALKYAIKNNFHISTGDAVDPEHNSTDESVNNNNSSNNGGNNNFNSKYSNPVTKNTNPNQTNGQQQLIPNPDDPIVEIRNLFTANQDLVENIVHKYLKDNDMKEDISLLNELDKKELKNILKDIKKQAS
jgi:hypothetical protein